MEATVDTNSKCPSCGSPVRRAFANSDAYVTCVRNGHVSPKESQR